MNSDPKKSLGQHWLHNDSVLSDIVDQASVNSQDTVIEIGPGLGTLTKKLLETGASVIAIEFDQTLLAGLQAKFSDYSNFTLINQDILKFDFTQHPSYKIVANIPYYLTSQLLRIIGDSLSVPSIAVLLVQKEVAERVCANPPDMSILSVAVQLEFTAKLGSVVPANMFTPPPKVDSQVLILTKRTAPLNKEIPKKEFMQVVKAGFSAKRKTLRNTLSAGLVISKPRSEEILKQAQVDMGLRAEALNLEQWYTLSKIVTEMHNT